jgi:hypothetical protein
MEKRTYAVLSCSKTLVCKKAAFYNKAAIALFEDELLTSSVHAADEAGLDRTGWANMAHNCRFGEPRRGPETAMNPASRETSPDLVLLHRSDTPMGDPM